MKFFHSALFFILFAISPLPLFSRTLVQLSDDHSHAALSLKGKGRYLSEVGLYLFDSTDQFPSEEILFREEEMPIQVENFPNDPLWSEQWKVEEDWGVELMEVWNFSTGHPELIVAVLDTGIDGDHPDLAENLWKNEGEIPGNHQDDDQNGYIDDYAGYDFVNDRATPEDQEGHGTHVAGIIGAVGNNGIGIAGICWKVRILPIKVVDKEGKGTTGAAIQGINYAIQQGAQIINASWIIKPKDRSSGKSEALRQALIKAYEAGILFVTAAGNGLEERGGIDLDQSPVYPASYSLPNVLTVAAATAGGDLAPFSNYGSHTVDLVAPGVNLLSTLPADQYGRMSGTSVAAAFASGSAALLLSLHPEWGVEKIESALLNSVRPAESLEERTASAGVIDIEQAIEWGQKEKTPSISQGGCSLIASY